MWKAYRNYCPLLKRSNFKLSKTLHRPLTTANERKFLDPNQPVKSFLKAFGIMLSGYTIGSYLESNNGLLDFRSAQAATRRDKFNFISKVVADAARSVVFIEVHDLSKRKNKSGKPHVISSGSGCIVESNGLIVTNAHVVVAKTLNSKTSMVVRLPDGRRFKGFVESLDRSSDLATVRIKCDDLPVISFGSSGSLKSGKWVVALGSPFTLSTVTCGIISARRKSDEIGMSAPKMTYIQTDASITEGNCGGPLLNLQKEVIGINSVKIQPGICFAIPSDHVKKYLARVKKLKAKRMADEQSQDRYAGMTMFTLNEDIIVLLKDFKKCPDVKSGVLINKVISESPAELGGLNPGDIVTHVNGKEVKNSSDIYDALLEKGKKLDMTVYRGLKQLRIVVEPEE